MAISRPPSISLASPNLSAKHTCSSSSSLSSFPCQWHRSHLKTSISYKSSFQSRFSSRSVNVAASTRRQELAVVTADTWDEYVLNSEIPVLVEFWAAWCGPCRMVHREIEEIAKEYIGRINCYILKADDDIEIADQYGVKVVPVVLLFKNGSKHDSVTGTMPHHVYVSAIEKLL